MKEFRKAYGAILGAGYDIEAVYGCDYLWEVETSDGWKMLTQEEVINFASERGLLS